jgi:hypothetical protein
VLSLAVLSLAPLVYLGFLPVAPSASLLVLVLMTALASVLSARLSPRGVVFNARNVLAVLLLSYSIVLAVTLAYRPLDTLSTALISLALALQAAQQYSMSLTIIRRSLRGSVKVALLLIYFVVIPTLLILSSFGHESQGELDNLMTASLPGLFYPSLSVISVETLRVRIMALCYAIVAFTVNLAFAKMFWVAQEEAGEGGGYRLRDLVMALGLVLLITGLAGVGLQAYIHHYRSTGAVTLRASPIAYVPGNDSLVVVEGAEISYVGHIPCDPGRLVGLTIDWERVENCSVYTLTGNASLEAPPKHGNTLTGLLKDPSWLSQVKSKAEERLTASTCRRASIKGGLGDVKYIVLVGETRWQDVEIWLTVWRQYEGYWYPDGQEVFKADKARSLLIGLMRGESVEEITGSQSFKSWRADLRFQLLDTGLTGRAFVTAHYKHTWLNTSMLASITQIVIGLPVVVASRMTDKISVRES